MDFAPALIDDSVLPASQSGRWCVAFSGGLDSTVLLHALHRRQRLTGVPGQLQALHVHHGLQAAADDWVRHCMEQAAHLDVPLQVLRVDVAPHDAAGPEAAARYARYQALQSAMQPGDVLVTAHHLDDQAETFLMRALRGAGTRGLAAMSALQPCSPGWLWRPLLAFDRPALARYAASERLGWVDDPHNQHPRYERSWLRTQVMPLLHQRWPSAARSLARSAHWSADSRSLLDELARIDDATCNRGERTLDCAALAALSPARRANLLRMRIEQAGLPTPPHRAIEQIDSLLSAADDAQPLLTWPGAELRRYRSQLWLLSPLPPEPSDWSITWDGTGSLALPEGCGALEAPADAVPRSLCVRFARGGEKIKARPDGPHRSLKNLYQEQGVPPWRRRRTPLVFEAGELRWVGALSRMGGADSLYQRLRWKTDGGSETDVVSGPDL